jgi:hypothetical protein
MSPCSARAPMDSDRAAAISLQSFFVSLKIIDLPAEYGIILTMVSVLSNKVPSFAHGRSVDMPFESFKLLKRIISCLNLHTALLSVSSFSKEGIEESNK